MASWTPAPRKPHWRSALSFSAIAWASLLPLWMPTVWPPPFALLLLGAGFLVFLSGTLVGGWLRDLSHRKRLSVTLDFTPPGPCDCFTWDDRPIVKDNVWAQR